MTTSRSTGSPSNRPAAPGVVARLAWLAALLVAAWILVRPGVAEARRRLVVLEFDGDNAEEFQDELVKFLKKSHSVIPLKKWVTAAEDLSATKVTDKNVRKVAKKLSIDGVITGTIEKRGSRYYVRLQLRDGTTGKKVAQSELVERSARFSTDGKATLTDELLAAIDELESAGDDDADDGGGAADDDRGFGRGKPPRDKGKPHDRDDADADDRDRGDDDADADEDRPLTAKEKKAAKDKAARDKAARDKAARDKAARDKARRGGDDEDEIEMGGDDDGGGGGDDDERVAADDGDDRGPIDDDDVVLHGDPPVEPDVVDRRLRPVDLSAGLSFTARRLSFNVDPGITPPLGYKSNPVAGIYVAADLYPLAFNKKNHGFTRDVGLTVVADRVIKMDSQFKQQSGMVQQLATTQQHLGFGVVYRHLVGAKLTITASIRYNKSKFVIDRSAAMGEVVDIPDVSYTYLDPGLGLRYVLGPKLSTGADARFMLVSDTGAMQSVDQYGGATVKGLDLAARLDYQVGAKLLVRASVGTTRIGFTFKGNGDLSNNRDPNHDPLTREVSGARDVYFGGALTGVYAF